MRPRLNTKKAGQAAIKQFDANKDGKLDDQELDQCPGLKAALSRLDPEGSGFITAGMIAKRIKQWEDSRLGRRSIICVVMFDGKPLDDAEVKFEPEAFLNDMLQWGKMSPAVGETNNSGEANITIPLPSETCIPGVPPGFYRVKITKVGFDIPVKYNTDTELGIEIAIDSDNIREKTIDGKVHGYIELHLTSMPTESVQ